MSLVRIFIRSVGFAVKGIRAGARERSFRIQLAVGFFTCVAGIFFRISSADWVIISFCIGIVLAAELFNSAIENIVDLVSPERHPVAGKIKDLAAGAVLILSLMTVVVGTIVFSNYVVDFFLQR